MRRWALAAPAGVRLVIGGADREAGLAWLDRCGVPEPPGVEWAGAVPHDEWLARVARARAFVNASRREDHGLAQLEALAAGTPLVTVPRRVPTRRCRSRRSLAPELVAADVSAPALVRACARPRAERPRATPSAPPPRWRPTAATPCWRVRDEVVPALGLA